MQRRSVTKALGAGLALSALGSGAERMRAVMITEPGGLHLDMYFAALAAATEIESVAVCDAGGGSEALARRILGPKLSGFHRDLRPMLAKEKPLLAAISMEGVTSPPVIDAALDAGCHVLAEKPACVRLEDFERLAAKARARNRYLVLALANRVDPVMIEARRLLRDGEIGKVYGVEVRFVADQTRLTQPAYHKSWRAQKARAAGGHLMWLGIHWLDLAAFVTGSPVQSVAAFTANVGGQPLDVEDSAAVAMRFANGTLGTLTSGYYLDKGYDSELKVWGANGWLLIQKHRDVPLQWYSNGRMHRLDSTVKPSGDVYAGFLRGVARACLGLQPPPLTTDESVAALKTVFACYRAAESGRSERVA